MIKKAISIIAILSLSVTPALTQSDSSNGYSVQHFTDENGLPQNSINDLLFDNDGYLGLYVPGSNFREFSKEIGTQATQGLSQVATPDNSDVRMNMLSQIFSTTTTTLSSLIRKNKAFLKYNYIVYLKENKFSND